MMYVQNHVAVQGWKHAAHIWRKSLIRSLLEAPDIINISLNSLCFISWCLINHFSRHRLQSPDFDLAPITAAPNWAEAHHGPPLVDERMTHKTLTPVMTQTRKIVFSLTPTIKKNVFFCSLWLSGNNPNSSVKNHQQFFYPKKWVLKDKVVLLLSDDFKRKRTTE